MKKISIFAILIFLISCGSVHNEIEINVKKTENTTNIDSLKRSIIRMDGITSVVICDSLSRITVVYNRFENSDLNILKIIKENGYKSEIIGKKRIKKK